MRSAKTTWISSPAPNIGTGIRLSAASPTQMGAQYVAEQGGAFWLLDIIAIAQRYGEAVKTEPFQVWTLKVHDNQKGTVTCDDGNGKELYRQELDYTDFALPAMKLCCADGTIGQGVERVILLPGEY